MSIQEITEVYKNNLDTELYLIEQAMISGDYIAFDAEYPGFVYTTPRDAPGFKVYSDLRYNVNRLNPIQFGFMIFDMNGNNFGTWQFNLSDFDPELSEEDLKICSISLQKRRSGIDFAKQRSEGINSFEFAQKFGRIMRKYQQKLKWVVFHGNYDLGYLMKILTNSPLPDTIQGFQIRVGEIFQEVYDIKCIAKCLDSALNEDTGLNKISILLGLNRTGKCHQAGSDALLTAQVYQRMKCVYEFDEKLFEEVVYGIEGRIVRRPPPQLIRIIPQPIFFQPIVRCIPMLYYRVPKPVFLAPSPIFF